MIRRLVVAAGLVAAAVLAASSLTPAAGHVEAYNPCPANTECGWEFYSDVARTHLVGGHTTNCQGVVLDWGTRQGYLSYIQANCGGVDA